MLLLLKALNLFSPYPYCKYFCCRLPILVIQAIGSFNGVIFNVFTFILFKDSINDENELLIMVVTFALTIGKFFFKFF